MSNQQPPHHIGDVIDQVMAKHDITRSPSQCPHCDRELHSRFMTGLFNVEGPRDALVCYYCKGPVTKEGHTISLREEDNSNTRPCLYCDSPDHSLSHCPGEPKEVLWTCEECGTNIPWEHQTTCSHYVDPDPDDQAWEGDRRAEAANERYFEERWSGHDPIDPRW